MFPDIICFLKNLNKFRGVSIEHKLKDNIYHNLRYSDWEDIHEPCNGSYLYINDPVGFLALYFLGISTFK